MGRKGLFSLVPAGRVAVSSQLFGGFGFGNRGLDLLPSQRCQAQVSDQTRPVTNVDKLPAEPRPQDSCQTCPKPAGPRPRLPPPKYGKHITVLSIDGGGIRGIIPSVVLTRLEKHLKDLENGNNKDKEGGDDVRIADYFDMIAGTSTGGLIAAMLAVPDNRSMGRAPEDKSTVRRPKYKAKDITNFYEKHGREIFRYRRSSWGRVLLGWADYGLRPLWPDKYDLVTRQLWGPKYDGKALEDLIKKEMEGITLGDTVTRIMVPAFDVHARSVDLLSTSTHGDLLLKDVCMATTAAPVYFPAYRFEHDGKEYNLVDGGVASNDPALDAIWWIISAVQRRTKENKAENPNFHLDIENPERFDFKKFLVISIGTGSANEKYKAKECARWGLIGWLSKGGHAPLMDIFSSNSAYWIQWCTGFLFHFQDCQDNYLRINPGLDFKVSLDDATKGNIKQLKQAGEKLLDQKLMQVQFEESKWERQPRPDNETNDAALKRFAEQLVRERNLRILKEQERLKKQ